MYAYNLIKFVWVLGESAGQILFDKTNLALYWQFVSTSDKVISSPASLHSWSPFSALNYTLLHSHGHPSLPSWSLFSSLSSALMVTLLCTHGHPSLHSWSPFSILIGKQLFDPTSCKWETKNQMAQADNVLPIAGVWTFFKFIPNLTIRFCANGKKHSCMLHSLLYFILTHCYTHPFSL